VVPEHRPAAVRPNSGEPAAGIGRARAGNDPRVPRGQFLCLVGAGRGPARGAPAAGGGGRCGRCTGDAAPPAGQGAVREVGVEVHGGDNALNLVRGGLRP
jgi:hypothetical protein